MTRPTAAVAAKRSSSPSIGAAVRPLTLAAAAAAVLVAAAVVAASSPAWAAGTTTQVNFELQTTDAEGAPITQNRTYYVYRPAGLSTATPVPMIVVMAYGAYGADKNLNAKADSVGFVVVTGAFSGNASGTPGTGWVNDNPRIVGPEDYDYTDEVIRRVKASENCNDAFIVGLSKGGHTAYAYACERPSMIRGASSIDEFMGLTQNVPSAPVPIIAFHGTGDTSVPYVMAKDSVDAWRAMDGLMNATPATTYESSPLIPGSVTQATWRGATGGMQVAFVTIVGGGHAYPTPSMQTGYNFADGLWAFFAQFLTSPQPPPRIVASPANHVQASGLPASFWVAATGDAPLHYQWQRRGAAAAEWADIEGANANWYTTPATSGADDGASFRAVVTNASGSTTSAAATLTVKPSAGPTITAQPADLTLLGGQTAAFSVGASSSAAGPAAPSYQWQKNGMSLGAGATAATYSTRALGPADSGAPFRVLVTDATGTVASEIATLTVLPAPGAPVIEVNPARLRLVVGGTGSFSVVASSDGPMSYQWQKGASFTTNMMDIPGATEASYTIATAAPSDNHVLYRCVVSNAAGSTTSAAEMAQVSSAATAPRDLMTLPTAAGRVGEAFRFTIEQSGGTLPITYSAAPLPPGLAVDAATGIISGTPEEAGTTTVVLSTANSAGSVTKPLQLTIAPASTSSAPSITQQPQDQSVVVGDRVSMCVVAVGAEPLRYAWRKDEGSQPIAGATGACLVIASATNGDAGSYRVSVSNDDGQATSDPARLTVTERAAAAPPPSAQARAAGCGCTAGADASVAPSLVLLGFAAFANSCLTRRRRRR